MFVYTIINRAYSASKRLAQKADTPSLMPKEDTLPRCQAPAEAHDAEAPKIAKTTLTSTMACTKSHIGNLHKPPTLTSL